MFIFQAALTYAEAQMKIDDPALNDDLTCGLRRLNSLAKILKRRRHENGCVQAFARGHWH
jgi:exosome complex exonuclease DIS3/RRP44